LWNISWGGSGDDSGSGVALDSNDNIYCSGTESNNLSIVKFHPNGTEAWNTSWGGPNPDGAVDVVLDSGDNIYCLGNTYNYGIGLIDIALVKFHPNGNLAWNMTWGGTAENRGFALDIDSSGNIYCVGFTDSFEDPNGDVVLLKIDSDGNLIWNVTWGGADTEWGYDITIDKNDNIYCTGYTHSFGEGFLDIFLTKFNPNGNISWNITWGGAGMDIGYGLSIDEMGDIYCTGRSHDDQFTLIKFNSEGEELWHEIWGGPNNELGFAIMTDSSGDIYCTGLIDEPSTGYPDLIFYKVYNLAPLINSTSATPSDGSMCVSKSPILSVNVSDLDGEAMNVSFYNADDESLIDSDLDISSGGKAWVQWNGLDGGTSYRWYAVVTDGIDSMTSETREFTTVNQAPNLPIIIAPENQSSGLGLNITFSMEVSDPDGNNVSILILNDYHLLGHAQSILSGELVTLNCTVSRYDTTYYWYVRVSDGLNSTESPIYQFTTMPDPNQNDDDIPGFEILPCIMGMIAITASIISLRKKNDLPLDYR
jgi:uncharacterized delta-60 repeat protein